MSTTRRRFLEQSAVAGLAVASLGGKAVAANDKLGVAAIGVRGQGNALLRTFAAQKDVVITHICDIDDTVRAMRGKETEQSTGRAPKLVKDYREILDDKSIDAV